MIIEVTTFEPRPDSDIDAFLAADTAVQRELMSSHPGLLRRTVGRGADGWVAVTLWTSTDAAEASAQRLATTEAGAAYASFLAPGSTTRRYEDLGG